MQLSKWAAYIFERKQFKLKEVNKDIDKKSALEKSANENAIDKELKELINRNKLLKNGISKIIKEINKTKRT